MVLVIASVFSCPKSLLFALCKSEFFFRILGLLTLLRSHKKNGFAKNFDHNKRSRSSPFHELDGMKAWWPG